jgi:hypothetical protein
MVILPTFMQGVSHLITPFFSCFPALANLSYAKVMGLESYRRDETRTEATALGTCVKCLGPRISSKFAQLSHGISTENIVLEPE